LINHHLFAIYLLLNELDELKMTNEEIIEHARKYVLFRLEQLKPLMKRIPYIDCNVSPTPYIPPAYFPHKQIPLTPMSKAANTLTQLRRSTRLEEIEKKETRVKKALFRA
jgi:hypothetical protein